MAEISRLPGPLAERWDWQIEGACRTVSPETFFHPEGERGPRRRAREAAAKAICGSCPVVTQCLQHALSVREPYGIWGGLSELERELLLDGSVRQAS
ncbi:Transcription factor WhiB [Intrasporangium chromatireducens Q5-1]|uniref:Transcriptional regulator WhiB n=1 Tax=Intrasporangium chromatireducens Q5-1 TaxID=584657 RepID=W9GF10_9MICO|nr:WhiB family transcriptional regulator [Intrasporangium chromatireducens]EWT03807.1 Transcription factor WhiB [Intrasporangium chromatireducens Q5-1]